MAYEFELTNFKAFHSTGAIPLRPLTLIYGPNSSGKSSLLQSLLLLKQTLDESETPETLLLPKGNLVDLGGYREFVNRHELERPFSIRLMQTVSSVALPSSIPAEIRKKSGISALGIQITFGYEEAAANAVVREVAFFVNDSRRPICTFRPQASEETDEPSGSQLPMRVRRAGLVFRVAETNEEHPLWSTLAKIEQDLAKRSFGDELQEALKLFKRELEQVEALEEAAKAGVEPKRGKTNRTRMARTFLDKQALRQRIEMYERELQMIERSLDEATRSFLQRHSRTYFVLRNFLPADIDLLAEREELSATAQLALPLFSHRLAPSVGPSLLTRIYAQASQMFRNFLEELVYLGPLRESPERHYVFSGNVTGHVGKTGRLVPDVLFKNRALLKNVNEKLEAFGVGYDLVITGASGGELHDVFSLRLLDRATKVSASILDVGFGISQVLPVIVQSMLSRNKVVCIEQPEIHLHPRLQAELGSLLAGCIAPPYNNQFVIETHSQHLILRLQRLIRKGDLKNSDVSVVYVDKDSTGSTCLPLRMDETGEFIDEWPHGFFEEGYEEIFAQ